MHHSVIEVVDVVAVFISEHTPQQSNSFDCGIYGKRQACVIGFIHQLTHLVMGGPCSVLALCEYLCSIYFSDRAVELMTSDQLHHDELDSLITENTMKRYRAGIHRLALERFSRS